MQQTQDFQPSSSPYPNNRRKRLSDLVCSSGNNIINVCVETKCNKRSLHCMRQECSQCFGLHPFCNTISLQIFENFLNINLQNQRHLLDIISGFQQKIIKNIQNSQIQLSKYLQYQGLSNCLRKFYFQAIEHNQFNNLTAIDIQALQEQIQNFTFINKQKQIINHCERFTKCVDQYLKQKQQIFYTVEGNRPIISKIINKEEDIDFIFAQLGKPKKLELLYRGSENHFSAAKFHQKCDQIQHTITIVRTQFDRIIAGYTPLKWSAPSTWTYFTDNSRRSFLLQIDQKQRFDLIQPLYSIYCHQSHGPRFGRSDLAITSKCNQNNCTGNFPTSYNKIGKYKNGAQSYKLFSGAQNGFNFRAVEYEVFKVIF